MTAFASVTLKNNAVADVIFGPQSIDGVGVATYLTSDAVFDAKKKLTMSVALPKNGSSVVRIKQKVLIPIMDTVDTTKKVAEAFVTIEAVIPKQASETNRLDLRSFANTLLEHAVSTAAYQNLESIY